MKSNSSAEVELKKRMSSPIVIDSSSDSDEEYCRTFTRKWVEHHSGEQPIVVDDELSSQGTADNELSSADDNDDNDSLSMSFGDEDYYGSDDVFFESDEDYTGDSGTSSGGSPTEVSTIQSQEYVPLLAVAQPITPFLPPTRRISSTASVTAHPVPITIPSASPHLPLPPNHLFSNAHHPVSNQFDTATSIPQQAEASTMSAPPGHTLVSADANSPSNSSVIGQAISNSPPAHSSTITSSTDSGLNDIDLALRIASAILSNDAFPANLLASDESQSLPPLSPRFTPTASPKSYLSE